MHDFSTMGLYQDITNHLRRHCSPAWAPRWGPLVYPDKQWDNGSTKRQPRGHGLFLWKSLRSLWKIGPPAWTSHSRSGRSYALSSHLTPGCCGTARAPARACPRAGAAAWLVPLPHALLLQRHCKTRCPWVVTSKIATEPVVIWYLWGIFTVRLMWNWLV